MKKILLLIFLFAFLISCKDTDGDGVYDRYDSCPDIEGLKEYDGCPDSDEDGIIDNEDDCPNEYGLEEFNGCPDSDEDGIQDSEDDCPEEFGLEKFNGCPDSDYMKINASDCFAALSLTKKEIADCKEAYEINEYSTINNKFCRLISDYIFSMRKIEREYEEKMSVYRSKQRKLQKMIDGGYIQTVWRFDFKGVTTQKLIVLKNKRYYLMVIGSGGECTMGTMIFDENNYNWQDVLVRESPYEEKYTIHSMRITDVSSNFEELNRKKRGY